MHVTLNTLRHRNPARFSRLTEQAKILAGKPAAAQDETEERQRQTEERQRFQRLQDEWRQVNDHYFEDQHRETRAWDFALAVMVTLFQEHRHPAV